MALAIKIILFICVIEVVRAQVPEIDVGGKPHGRFIPRLVNRSGGLVQPLNPAQKIRRPLPINRSKPLPDDFSPLPVSRPKPNFLPTLKIENPSTPPSQLLQQDQPAKPVSEEIREEEEEIGPQPLIKIGPQNPHFFQPQSNFVPNVLTPKPQPIIQFRPSPPPVVHKPSSPIDENIAPIQYRPAKPIKIRKPIDDVSEIQNSAKENYQSQYNFHLPQKQIQQSYAKQSPKKATSPYREKKPVAQIIRRWREDNEDGSITWGFENDDGSYKEEIIGIDCVTRGKYGYIDPDGVRREYTYETGIKCDEEQQQDDQDNGFVDYQENKLVLPNGKTIDLSSMGKKQARRPQPIYRN